ncbi:MAG: M20/M25/M40 family metallo-hydrolase [Phycisphaerales bacterium]|jgi:acetylornithine deacetylase|nr:M20/M25/M40 family metallo-hydrolase [Phycisphaerales bacterium]
MPEQRTGTPADRTLLSELMAIDKTSGGPSDPALDRIGNLLDDAGCDVCRLPGAGTGRDNLIAIAGPAGEPGGLSLSGHVDTVPVGEGWRSDPFTLTQRDGRWYGRGSCDMTGFVAMATNLLREAGQLEGPLALILTSDEELGSIGAGVLAENAASLPPLPKACVVGEPTSLRVVRLHKGHLKFTITVRGATGHTGTPLSGVNAIDGARRVLAAIDEERARLEDMRSDESTAFVRVPHPVLSAVRLRAGTAWNVIPDEAAVDCGLRVLPDQDAAVLLDEIRAAVDAALAAWPLDWSLDVYNSNPPMRTPRGSEIEVACRALVGQEQDIGVSYCSDGGHLGRLGLDCVLFGPGDIAVAHRPDEYVPEADMIAARDHLKRLIAGRCGGGA